MNASKHGGGRKVSLSTVPSPVSLRPPPSRRRGVRIRRQDAVHQHPRAQAASHLSPAHGHGHGALAEVGELRRSSSSSLVAGRSSFGSEPTASCLQQRTTRRSCIPMVTVRIKAGSPSCSGFQSGSGHALPRQALAPLSRALLSYMHAYPPSQFYF